MKIIHTSDWHLGQEFYSYDRTEEHCAFFTQLNAIVKQEQPDALVVSGDIYHNATPSNAVMRMFVDQLDLIRNSCPTMSIVVIAGNHDSSSRIEVNRTLWGHLGVHIIGKLEKNTEGIDLERLIIPIVGGDDTLKGYVVALPYISPNSYPLIEPDTPRELRQHAFMTALAAKVEAINTQQVPVVLSAHMAIAGSDITGHNLTQGGMDYLNLSDLVVDYDYLALGHIHCPQFIHSSVPTQQCARYSGSPIPVNFDERYVHSVTLVEMTDHHSQPVTRTIPIENPWPLKTIPKDAVPFDEALHMLEEYPDDQLAYIRLHVKVADVAPQNALERATTAVAHKRCRFCCFKWEMPEQLLQKKRTFADVDQMKSHSPLEIAQLYYENKYGQELDPDLKEMLAHVISEVEHQRATE